MTFNLNERIIKVKLERIFHLTTTLFCDFFFYYCHIFPLLHVFQTCQVKLHAHYTSFIPFSTSDITSNIICTFSISTSSKIAIRCVVLDVLMDLNHSISIK